MQFSEKLVILRKQKSWSQEQLAIKLNISRQSVAKWESGACMPDTSKLISLSEIFQVSLDDLLLDTHAISINDTAACQTSSLNSNYSNNGYSRDNHMFEQDYQQTNQGYLSENKEQNLEYLDENEESNPFVHYLSMNEAKKFHSEMVELNLQKAGAIALYVLSPSLLLGLLSISELVNSGLFAHVKFTFFNKTFYLLQNFTEDVACILGCCLLLIICAFATWLITYSSERIKKWKWMKKKILEEDPQTISWIKETAENEEIHGRKLSSMGIFLFILCPVPVIMLSFFSDAGAIFGTALLLVLAAAGTAITVFTDGMKDTNKILLQQGKYSVNKKKKNLLKKQNKMTDSSVYEN